MSEEYTLLKTFAGLPRTVRGRPITIHADPKGKTFLYCNGNSVFIRDIEDSSTSDVYTQHAKDTTVAAYAPSGFYICSADITGKIRIWDTVNKEHLLKYEYQVMGGTIKDIAWTEDSKRIAVCGEGRQVSANVIMWDTGTSVGRLEGPSKACNNVDIKQTRPYRLILSSEDYSSYFYEGPPFKYKSTGSNHTNFVNCCRFSRDGSKYATGGADGKLFLFDGKTGELLGELCEPAGKIHNGGIYGMAWSPDSKQLMTCSADKTVKVWNIDEKYYISNKVDGGDEASMGLHCVFKFEDMVENMQVGCAWIGDTLLSVSLSGNINYLDLENPTSPKRIVKGHNKSIVASCLNEDRSLLLTASFDGLICYWDLSKGVAEPIEGQGHTNQVQQLSCMGDSVISCGMDDTIRLCSLTDKAYKDTVLQTNSQPQGVSVGQLGMAVVACLEELVVVQDMKVTHTYKIEYEAKSVAVNASLGKVVVGTDEVTSKVIVYDIVGDELKETDSFPINGNATDLKFSPDNQFLAVCTGKKQVKIIHTSDFKTEKANWGAHAGKVNSLAWTPDSRHLASCGVDGAVYTYDVEKAARGVNIRGAHSQSVDVTSIQWSDDNTLITTGRQDCSVCLWQIKH